MPMTRSDSIDLERAVTDPEYRRQVIADLSAKHCRRNGGRPDLQPVPVGIVNATARR